MVLMLSEVFVLVAVQLIDWWMEVSVAQPVC